MAVSTCLSGKKKRNLSQRQVALAIGVTDQTISNWEQKIHKPKLTPEQTLALCKVLDCSLEELVTGISSLETNSSNARKLKATALSHQEKSDRPTAHPI